MKILLSKNQLWEQMRFTKNVGQLVQPFWRLLDINKQIDIHQDRQAKFIYIDTYMRPKGDSAPCKNSTVTNKPGTLGLSMIIQTPYI